MGRGLAAAHTPANCRWSRLGFRLSFVEEPEQPETRWICVREAGTRRPLADSECAYCEFWEATDERRAAEGERGLWA
jgi:hypothetical protein